MKAVTERAVFDEASGADGSVWRAAESAAASAEKVAVIFSPGDPPAAQGPSRPPPIVYEAQMAAVGPRRLAEGVDLDLSSACLVIDGVRISLLLLRSLVATLATADQAEWRLERFYRDGNAIRVDRLPISGLGRRSELRGCLVVGEGPVHPLAGKETEGQS